MYNKTDTMETFESQIAKITLGNFKQTKSYVYVMAEKAPASEVELYVVAELPLFNPAAIESCERICSAIGSSLKRAYRQHASEGTFENALSYINDELSKLASTGQTHWINKLNCIVATKQGQTLSVASCGKVFAYLLREHEFTDISCSTEKPSPVKTFESYASGRIRLNDLIIFSTTQMFNYLSIDRVKNILGSMDFLPATQTIIEQLKANAGPEVAFGILMNLQVEPGQTTSDEVDLESYLVETPMGASNVWDKTKKFISELLMIKTRRGQTPVLSPTKTFQPVSARMEKWSMQAKTFGQKIGATLTGLGKFFWSNKKIFTPNYFQSLSGIKKFFYTSIIILFLALVLNIWVAIHIKNNREASAQTAAQLSTVQKLLNNAQSALVYNDQKQAADLIQQAKTKFQAVNSKIAPKDEYQKINTLFNSLDEKIDRTRNVKITLLGNLSPENRLISLPGFLATETNNRILSYDLANGQIQDNVLKSPETIRSSVATKNGAVIYNGSALFVWKPQDGKTGPGFTTSVPVADNFINLKYYPANNRVYVLDRSQNSAISFLINGDKLQKPVIALKNVTEIGQTQDFAIDGSIYFLTRDAVVKYSAGKLAEFNLPYLSKPFSGEGRIVTYPDFKHVYLLDIPGKRIIVTDKTGNLMYTVKNEQITRPKDFEVDEKNKVIYLLNGSELLKIDLQ